MTTSPSPTLQVEGLSAGYGKALVLDGLSLQAPQGSIVTVIGPNGAGKSTLLGAIMGTLPSVGTLRFNGESIESLTLEDRVMAGIALVPEKRELFTTMTVERNLLLGGWRPRRLGKANWRSGMEKVYTLFPRLLERRQQLAGTLSGGERQMLAIGRALMAQPKLLMLDEPSLGLAPLVVREIFKIIRELNDQGVTILLVEQNARAALKVAHTGYVLEGGAIAASGPSDVLADDARIFETYLGSGQHATAHEAAAGAGA